jgi:flagellar biosynthesis chaperone FliJ
MAQAKRYAMTASLQEDATRGVWRRAKQELEITERLEDRRRQAAALEEDRRASKVLDEVAANRHGRTL